MSIEVLGHQLPPLLVKLMEDGKWGMRNSHLPAETFTKLLEKAGLRPLELGMGLNGIEGMKRETLAISSKEHPKRNYWMKEVYYEASSKEENRKITDEGFIDIDNAVFIAGNMDEEAICLDYRENPDNPCVMATLSPNWKWCMIAPDFETFARELGLVE